MFTVNHTIFINDAKPQLNRSQVWQGLLLKAENPVPFLKSMSACTVIDRGDNWLLRNFTLRGEDMQERVTFCPEKRVTFRRTKSSVMGTVTNEIVELKDGEIGLRFIFSLDVEGLEEGSLEEKDFVDLMFDSYSEGVHSTLNEIRRRVATGKLSAK